MKFTKTSLFVVLILFLFSVSPSDFDNTISIGTDIARADEGGYVIYHENETWYATFANPACVSDTHDALLSFINSATSSIDVAAYAWGCPDLTNALVSKHAAGVYVRGVLETDNSTNPAYLPYILQLISAGVPVVMDDDGDVRMHNNFVVVDGSAVFAGSGTFTPRGFTLDISNWLEVYSSCVASLFQQEFDELFNGDFGHNNPTFDSRCEMSNGSTLDVFFAPSDRGHSALIGEMYASSTSIDVMSLVFTSRPIAAAVVYQADNGLNVTGHIDYWGGADIWGLDNQLCDDDVDWTTWNRPGLLYNNTLLLDTYTGNPRLWLGSQNLSGAGENINNAFAFLISGDNDISREAQNTYNTIEFLTPEEWTCDSQLGDYSIPFPDVPVSLELCIAHECPSVWSWLLRVACEQWGCFTWVEFSGNDGEYQAWQVIGNTLNAEVKDGEWKLCQEVCTVATVEDGVVVDIKYLGDPSPQPN